MPSLENLRRLLLDEAVQKQQEGCRVDALRERIESAGNDEGRILKLYARLSNLKPGKRFGYEEPSDLDGIRRQLPKSRWRPPRKVSDRLLRDRLLGAIQGRCAGCLLGKPVEGRLYEQIKKGLTTTGHWPLRDYFRCETIEAMDPAAPPSDARRVCCKGRIRQMPRDDDIDYTILGVHILKQYGPNFSTRQVGTEWLSRLPYHKVYTAERCAYRNLVNEVPIDACGEHLNPYREWIGAQIRADGFGYCAAGLPKLAAEFAWRDAWLSHRKNGIYGEMLFAAMIAAALVCSDLEEVIEASLEQIPANCRLAEAVRQTVAWSRANGHWEQTFAKIQEHYGHYHRVHTINNAAVVIMALMHGKGDLTKTIGIAVMAGWDTDCNGATAGSVLGALLGASRLPLKWIRPMRDTIRSEVQGYDGIKMSALAGQAYRVCKDLRK